MAVNPIFQRLHLLTGTPALDLLRTARVAIFGLGGVGSWAAEALVRSGVCDITLVDNDVVCITNVNRQLQATTQNVGKSKAGELKERILVLNPRCKVTALQKVYEPDTAAEFELESFDYVLDCIDSISCKVDLIRQATAAGTRLYSSMGAASKLDPTRIQVADIWETQGCPLARLMRRHLRATGFDANVTTVYSPEVLPPVESTSVACGTHSCHCPSYVPDDGGEHKDWCATKNVINGSAVHITATFGLFLAGLVVQNAVARAETGTPTADTPTSPFDIVDS